MLIEDKFNFKPSANMKGVPREAICEWPQCLKKLLINKYLLLSGFSVENEFY